MGDFQTPREAVCAARTEWQARAEALEAEVGRLREALTEIATHTKEREARLTARAALSSDARGGANPETVSRKPERLRDEETNTADAAHLPAPHNKTGRRGGGLGNDR